MNQMTNQSFRRSFILPVLAVLATLVPTTFAQMGFGVSHVEVSAEASTTSAAPGDHLTIAVVLDHDEGYHSHTHDPVIPEEMGDFFAIPTTIKFSENDAFTTGQIQWPEEHSVAVDFGFENGPVDYKVYSEKAIAYVPLQISDDAPEGELTVEITIGFQACNDTTCDAPSLDKRTVTIQIGSESFKSPPSALFDGFDLSTPFVAGEPADDHSDEDTKESAPTASSSGSFFGIAIPTGGIGGLAVLALFGAAGGFILNLTPCVLPVIPIKVMTLSKHAGEDRMKAIMLGFWMALGVVAFWAALAIPVLTLQGFTDPSRIFGIWWLTTSIGIVIVVMSFGLMGLFEIKLPQKAYMVNAKADSPSGSFLFGIMTAILGLPCFGFVAGALVPAAITQGTAFVIVLFTSMGVGMALPYLVLAIFPQLVNKLPKTGPASDLVKQMMALLLLAAGAYFIGSGLIALIASKPYLAKLLHIWIAALFGLSAGLWLMLRTFQISPKPINRIAFTLIALVIAASGILIANRFTVDAHEEYELRKAALAQSAGEGVLMTTTWNDYSPALMQRALDEGFVVILDFTAEWCINCKVLEKTVLGVEPVKSMLRAEDTVMIKVDLTGKNPEGEKALSDLGRTGIPTLAIFGPGLEQPWIASAYTREQVASAIKTARGGEPED
ncbi:MAG: thioredoxin family protein [Phycisphaerales bacterium]|nr:thioredoxin family protein [Phycisphaerales bacterium]